MFMQLSNMISKFPFLSFEPTPQPNTLYLVFFFLLHLKIWNVEFKTHPNSCVLRWHKNKLNRCLRNQTSSTRQVPKVMFVGCDCLFVLSMLFVFVFHGVLVVVFVHSNNDKQQRKHISWVLNFSNHLLLKGEVNLRI